MRAKLIKEDSKKILKGKSGKDIINARVQAIDEFQNKLNNVFELFKVVASDYQLDADSEDYMGFLNVGADMFYDKKLKTAYRDFVQMYNDPNSYRMTRSLFNELLSRLGLEIEDGIVDEEETVFANK